MRQKKHHTEEGADIQSKRLKSDASVRPAVQDGHDGEHAAQLRILLMSGDGVDAAAYFHLPRDRDPVRLSDSSWGLTLLSCRSCERE